ncbi:hypothetical protein UY3_08516 [Chelonia mydas]|uniref:Myb/SANT-like DNA-binding domain-containing protein n=1 Tax=Chelonia mydas TaxID=8469 RepID=M7C1S1_CHEMY|nr:hypothetical protein UY3_08516 [Chelonia mydas]
MDAQGYKRAPAWSTQKVVDLIAVWGEEFVQAEHRYSRRNTNICAKIMQVMGEKGYTRDMQQCRVKIKELRRHTMASMEPAQITTAVMSILNTLRIIMQNMQNQNLQKQPRR